LRIVLYFSDANISLFTNARQNCFHLCGIGSEEEVRSFFKIQHFNINKLF